MEGLNRYYSMIYIADFIVINRRDFQDHLRVLFQGMTRIQKYGLRLREGSVYSLGPLTKTQFSRL